jgi:hypothetical protein
MRARKDKPVETGRAAACRRLERKEDLSARIKSVVDAHEAVALTSLGHVFVTPFFVLEHLVPRLSDGRSGSDIRSCICGYFGFESSTSERAVSTM